MGVGKFQSPHSLGFSYSARWEGSHPRLPCPASMAFFAKPFRWESRQGGYGNGFVPLTPGGAVGHEAIYCIWRELPKEARSPTCMPQVRT